MSGFSTEQIVKVNAPKISILYKIILIVAVVLATTTIPQTGLIGLGIMVLFIITTILVFEYYSSEFEYCLVDDALTVDRIMGKTRRIKCGSFDMSRTTLVADMKAQEALRMQGMDLRTFNYSSGKDSNDDIVIYTYDSEANEQIRLFIEADDNMLEAIKNVVNPNSFKVNR